MNAARFFVGLASGEFSAPVKLRYDSKALLDKRGKLIAEFESQGECLEFAKSLVALGRKLLEKKRKKEGV